MVRAVVVALVLVAGCGTKTPEAPAPSVPSATAAATTPVEGGVVGGAPAPRKPRKPFEVYNGCADVVTIAFADDPKAASAGRKPVAPSSTVEGPRNDDGNQTVWLVDDKGEPIAKVSVTRGMKRVEVGRSCRTLDAR